MSPRYIAYGVALLAIVILIANIFFIVPQTSQAIVVQFGQIVRVIRAPGLYARVPFVQAVSYFDRRIIGFDAQPAEFITHDPAAGIDERVVIDAFVRYRITDPVKFYQAFKTEENADSRMGSIVLSAMRRVLGDRSLSDLLSATREPIMEQIKSEVNAVAKGEISVSQNSPVFGIEVIDVRIMRADLPADISQSTYERMRKNFTKEAQLFRAQGDEQATETRAAADREKIEILSEARKQSETIRGEGDGEAAQIYAAAFGRDPEFYRFYRSMQAYRRTLGKDDTTMVMTPESGFLKEMNQ